MKIKKINQGKLLGDNNEIRNKSILYLNYKKINNYDYKFSKIGKYTILILFKSLLININKIFYNCSSLISLNLSNFNTNKVTDMSHMFYKCSSLTSLNLSNFNTNKVNNMSYMFSNCSSLTSLNLSNFNTNNVTNMSGMFSNCSSLSSLNF